MKIVYYLLSMALFFVACNGDDDADLSPTGETNWLVLEDSEDEVDHLAYMIFEESGIPIYYNDTIARIPVGQMASGEEVFHYELLGVNYQITGSTKYNYELLTDRDEIKAGIEMLRDHVIPNLLDGMLPRSFFLTAEFKNEFAADKKLADVEAYKALKTTCVNWAKEENAEEVAAAVLAVEYATFLQEREEELPLLAKFYVESEGISGGNTKLLYGQSLTKSNGTRGDSWDTNVETFGFLSWDKTAKKYTTSWKAPSKSQDLADYVKVVLLGDDEGFQKNYAKYEKCLQKYDLMKQIVEDLQTAAKE